MPHLEEEWAPNCRGAGAGWEGRGRPELWKIEAEVESEEENWAASHGPLSGDSRGRGGRGAAKREHGKEEVLTGPPG